MKTTKFVQVLGISAAIVLVAGCSKNQSQPTASPEAPPSTNTEGSRGTVERAKEVASATAEVVVQTKNQTVATAEKEMQAIDAKINALAQKSQSYTNAAKTEAEAALAQLRQQRDTAARKLEELKAAGQDNWQDAKAGINSALEQLEQTYDTLKAKFKT
ncbi:MAG TPA: hypothetical protein VKA67_08655 [Verrucomicrobiae bacterium]|nr:hypothetical protein [Verrucomicrobiae bacterium]